MNALDRVNPETRADESRTTDSASVSLSSEDQAIFDLLDESLTTGSYTELTELAQAVPRSSGEDRIILAELREYASRPHYG